MKLTLTIILIFFLKILNGQDFKYINPNLGDSCSVILAKTDSANYYEKLVFIDYKINSPLKEKVADFRLSDDSFLEIAQSFQDIIKIEKINIRKTKHQLPEKWIKINKYKGKWVLYDDIEFNTRYILSDSSLVNFYMDGLSSDVIKKYNSSNNYFQFTLSSLSWKERQSTEEYTLNIKIIDKNKMITLWEFKKGLSTSYLLMIPETQKIHFPVIGVLTTDLMGDESEILDLINYENLKKE